MSKVPSRCPLCGSEVKVCRLNDGGACVIMCPSCLLRMPVSRNAAQAVTFWNDRCSSVSKALDRGSR